MALFSSIVCSWTALLAKKIMIDSEVSDFETPCIRTGLSGVVRMDVRNTWVAGAERTSRSMLCTRAGGVVSEGLIS